MSELALGMLAATQRVADQVWSIRESSLHAYLAARVGTTAKRIDKRQLVKRDGKQPAVAVIELNGVMVPDAMFADEVDTGMLTAALESFAENDGIAAGVLVINSPGGSTAGLAEAVNAAREFASRKPLTAIVEGCCCSAAYRVASQANQIYAGARDDIGSIGTRSLVYDWSQHFAQLGIEAVVSDTGPLKSLGVAGTPVTDDQRDFLQERVDYLQEDFRRDVMQGRGMTDEEYQAVATGGYWFGEQAVGLKLIDGVRSKKETLAAVYAAVATQTLGGQDMAETTEPVAPKAATAKQIREKYPNTTAEFREELVESGATMAEVAEKWAAHCESALAAEKQAREEAEKKAEKAAQKPADEPTKSTRGVESVSNVEAAGASFTDPATEWADLVTEHAEKCGGNRLKGFQKARRANPELARAARDACRS